MSSIDETKVESYWKFFRQSHLPETKYLGQLEYLMKYRAEAAQRYFKSKGEETVNLKELIEYINNQIKELLAL